MPYDSIDISLLWLSSFAQAMTNILSVYNLYTLVLQLMEV